jgi:hypothetical protein
MDYAEIKKEYQDAKFTVEGEWWPSFAPEHGGIDKMKVLGKLTYTPEEGSFLTLNFKSGSQWGSPIIHGRAKDEFGREQEYTCLYPAYHDGRHDSMTYKVDLVIKGVLLDSIETARFSNISFSLKNLNAWVKSSGFSLEGKDFWASFTIKYQEHIGEWTPLTDGLEFRISQHAFPIYEPNYEEINEISAQEKVTIEIQTCDNAVRPINDLLNRIPIFVDFFTISASDICSPYGIHIHGDTGKTEQQCKSLNGSIFLSNNSYSNNVFQALKYNFIFREEDLEHTLGEHMSSWINNYDKVLTQISLLKSTFCGNQYAESEFLTLCQAVESYHRNIQGGQYIAQETYDKDVFPVLTNAIPTTLEASFKQSIKTKLKYANEFSLRKRLTQLIGQHSYIFDKRIQTTDGLASKIVDARNYFTHYTQDAKQVQPYPLNFYSTVLRSILTVSILAQMGFSSRKIVELSERCEQLDAIKYSAPPSLWPQDATKA